MGLRERESRVQPKQQYYRIILRSYTILKLARLDYAEYAIKVVRKPPGQATSGWSSSSDLVC